MFKGWSNGERALAICLALAIVLLVFFDHQKGCGGYYGHDDHAQTSTLDDSEFYFKLWDLRAQWANAAGTFLVFILTAAALLYSVRANGRALRETARSNDTLISVERGRLNVEFVTRDVAEDGGMTMRFTVENIGRSALIITGINIGRYQDERNEAPPFIQQDVPITERFQLVRAGATQPQEVFIRPEKGKPPTFIIYLVFRYESGFSVRMFGTTFATPFFNHAIMWRQPGEGYHFDLEPNQEDG